MGRSRYNVALLIIRLNMPTPLYWRIWHSGEAGEGFTTDGHARDGNRHEKWQQYASRRWAVICAAVRYCPNNHIKAEGQFAY